MSAATHEEFRFESQSLDEAATVLGETYARTRISDRRQPSGTVMRIHQRTLTPDVRLDELEFGLGFSAAVDPLETLVFTELNTGRTRFDAQGRSRAYEAGESYLVAQPDQAYIGTVEDVTMSMVIMRPSLLDKVAATAGPAGVPIRFLGHEPTSPQAALRWRGACTYVRSSVVTLPNSEHNLFRSNAASLLASVALDSFANTASREPSAQDGHDAHPLTLRRAVRFIEDNAGRDIAASDIAAAASVSVRALQLAFRRHLDTTPMAYLRRVRLAHAHSELEAGCEDELTVMSTATRWGFGNPGRFARLFRDEYGRAPSEVLRSS
ncbi:helix-turn-helix transcriptional regulator [Rothia sp. ARF10]|jgi:AraC-like DNA-binding protein|nr:helix-turn-helix transcriptional regulator [Rothia sp. ARF10]